mmetsp:Transcript_14329/g.41358  ORF Transcript_14329/g.41358 Transcript_14329/m.41358 type:complete len:201 (+) Transcript_14329:115-717(+)
MRISGGLSFRLVSAAALFVRSSTGVTTRNLGILPLSAFVSASNNNSNNISNPRSTFYHSSSRLPMTPSPNDEVEKAQEAAKMAADGAPPTVFDKIISGEWSSDKIHEDDVCLAFRDINPQAPVHFLVIPKNRDGLTQLTKAREDQKALLGHLMYVAQELGQKECPDGFRITINDGKDGAQSVYHLHLHVMGGRQMAWPPG